MNYKKFNGLKTEAQKINFLLQELSDSEHLITNLRFENEELSREQRKPKFRFSRYEFREGVRTLVEAGILAAIIKYIFV